MEGEKTESQSKLSSKTSPPTNGATSTSTASNSLPAREAMDVLLDISKLLNTGLDAYTLAICMKLCENGANPEALALVIQELRRETANYRALENELKNQQ